MKSEIASKESGHFHISVNKTICGGRPVVKGTRIAVADIAGYYLMGMTPEEIKRDIPHLGLAQIFDALAFYFDHKALIDRQIAQDREKTVSRQYSAGKY